MKNSKYSKWTLSIMAIAGLIGVTLAQLINFDLSAWLGGATAATILVIINIILVTRKSDKTPEVDERIINNIKNYYFYIFLVFSGVALVGFTVLLFLEIETIAVTTLFIVFIGYFALSGIGAMIVSKR